MTTALDRKAMTFTDLREHLTKLRDMRHDVVLNSSHLLAADDSTLLSTPEVEDVITPHGVGIPPYELEITPHALQQIASKWKIPVRYLRDLMEKSAGGHRAWNLLWADTLNTHFDVENMDVLVRALVEPGEKRGVLRAMLSPSYGFIEHFDVLTAVFDGLRVAREIHKIDFEPGPAHISDTQMRARVNMPQLSVVAEALLKNYVSPFTGNRGVDNPNIFLGLDIRNSEVGAGSFNIVPVIVVQVCDNGMTMTKDLFRKVHLGSRMENGVMSDRTARATMELIASQTSDYVMNIATPEFLQSKVDELMGLAVKVEPTIVQDHLKSVYSDDEADAIFNAFISCGDHTAFGVAQAMTAVSQTDQFGVDAARDLDDNALLVATAVARLA